MYDIHKYKYLNSYLKKCKVIYLFLNKKVVTCFFLFFLMFLHQNNLRKQALVSYQVKKSIQNLY